LKKIEEKRIKIEKKIISEEEKLVGFAKYEETRFAKWSHALIRKIIGPIVRWLWVGKVEGLHNIPKEGPVIIASNHESYFDFLCFSAISPRKIHYLAAEKFFKSRLWRPLMKMTGQIRVDRDHPDKSKVFSQVLSALEQGRMIGIFPEGTRSRDGKMLKAFTGIAQIALKAKVPIVPVGVKGTYEIMAPHNKFPKLNKKADFNIGEAMHFKEFHDIVHTDKHFRIVTDKVMVTIGDLCGKGYPHVEKIEEDLIMK
jgi:1-acyl-sn-glycerol-3-phosphate acyltransferase